MKTKLLIRLAAGLTVMAASAPILADGQAPPTDGSAASSVPAATRSSNVFAGPFRWKSTGPLISPISNETHKLVSVKDPTVVYYGDRWHVYATTADTRGQWNMVYLSFSNWSEAQSAKPYYLDSNPNLRGYHCAPQVFYFRPQKKWYLIYQSQPPTYSTADDVGKPETWSKPEYFFASEPPGVPKLWIDYWVICDEKNAYLFSSGDDGRFYRCQTKIQDFPKGFSNPVVVMQSSNQFDLFEASCTYRLKGTGQYLALIEAIGKSGHRYYKAFLADRLDGEWTPLADTWDNPFAGITNVTFDDGVKPWTQDISHGEILRDGYDETLTIDPRNLQFLYQGMDSAAPKNPDYSQLPWQLGLLRLDSQKK
jgi:hypothetical protein